MKRTIFMIGDSIMQTNLYDTYPQTGWGQVLYLFAQEDVEIINLAKNGTSTKSFLDLGYFQYIEEHIKKDDLLIIGFGHNDQKEYDPSRYVSPYGGFIDNLSYFINIAKSHEAKVILTTPIIRRKFQNGKIINTHGEYIEAVKKCAKENDVPFVDLNLKTKEFYESIGEEKSKAYFMNFEEGLYEHYPHGEHDDSHQRYEGAILIAKFFVEDIHFQNLAVKNFFLPLNKITSSKKDTYEN